MEDILMSNRPVYLTQQGYTAVEKELQYLKDVRRKEIASRLHNALGEGELIENAELEEARREQSYVEGRILALEEQLRKAKIIDTMDRTDDVVSIGSRVKIQEDGESSAEEYLVVGSAEADPRNGKISNESPLGLALLGKRVGEKAVVQAPAGDIVFKVIELR
jgi:transcription elongation factor GreA